ncbi:mechanosensitive ion channel [Candidatus Woesearchaeota archaeon]|nr:mechanosensitive ion channel [Candidatus Woesearchaeota archaeon]
MDGAIVTAETVLYTIATVLITLFVGVIIAKLAGRLIKRILAEAEINRLLKDSGLKAIDQRVASLVEITIYVITGLLILQALGLTQMTLGIVIVAGTLAIAAFLFLTLRTFIPNWIQGFSVRKELRKQIGKDIQIGTIKGRLLEVKPSYCVIKERERIYIPHRYTASSNFK